MIWFWVGFLVLVLFLLAFDLGVLNRKDHVISTREALRWTAFWIFLALLFNVFIYFMYEGHWLGISLGSEGLNGHEAALQYLTAYIIEKSLSLDNIFVFAVIFSYFRVPDKYQHRVLFWGILGALITRGIMIGAGTALLHRFSWFSYVFGAILILTAVRLWFTEEEGVDPEHNPLLRLTRRYFPITPEYHEQHFAIRQGGRLWLTPLFLVLLVVESTDIMFAVDSIPAVLAITRDPFIVFTSNVFAILGLRALYFALAGMIREFRYLKPSLVLVLLLVGVKMLLAHHAPIPTPISLLIVLGIVAGGVVMSLVNKETEETTAE